MRFSRKPIVLALLLPALALSACGSETTSSPAEGERVLDVMTQNVWIGVDVDGVLMASETAELAGLVDDVLAEARASDYPRRAGALARTIAEHEPDVVGLQEVALWRTQTPADGAETPAEEIALDFLELLLEALRDEGLDYVAAAVNEGIDLELTGGDRDVRLTDRDVFLVGPDVDVFDATSGTFEANLTVPSALGEVTVPRGWVAIDIELAGESVRLVNTHLEVQPFAGVQQQQASELVEGPLDREGAVILMGDVNAQAGDGTDTYSILLSTGLSDVWTATELDAAAGGTCCRDADLGENEQGLSERIDIIASSDALDALGAVRVGIEPGEQTADGRWYSDHAGVVATLALG